MKCDIDGRDAEKTCTVCGKALCNSCAEIKNGRAFCKSCSTNAEKDAGNADEKDAGTPGPEALEKTGDVCNECGAPLTDENREKLGENSYCRACVQKARENISLSLAGMTRNINWMKAIAAGLVVSALGAFIWYFIEIKLSIRLGIVAIAIGYGVALAVMWGAGGKRGMGLQIISTLLTLAGIMGGLFLSIHSLVMQEIAKGTFPAATPGGEWLITIMAMPFVLKETSIFSWAIIAFGLYQGFTMPAMPKIDLNR